jgi:hypothetical protein
MRLGPCPERAPIKSLVPLEINSHPNVEIGQTPPHQPCRAPSRPIPTIPS